MNTLRSRSLFHFFVLCSVIFGTMSQDTVCVKKPDQIHVILKEKKRNEKRLRIWTCISIALTASMVGLIATALPHSAPPATVINTTPLNTPPQFAVMPSSEPQVTKYRQSH